jgi:phosphoenolpyruvate carboxylase
MDAITTYLGYGSYAEWDEDKRIEFLVNELQVVAEAGRGVVTQGGRTHSALGHCHSKAQDICSGLQARGCPWLTPPV